MSELEDRIESVSALADAVHQVLASELEKLGFEIGSVPLQVPSEASYHLAADTASGEQALMGEWRDPSGRKAGSLVFHADGSFFVEQDVVRTHPEKPEVFVEAVTAWGRDAVIKAEPRFLQWES